MTRPLGRRQREMLLRIADGDTEMPFAAWREPNGLIQSLVRRGLIWAEFSDTKHWDGEHAGWRVNLAPRYTVGLTTAGEATAAIVRRERAAA